MAFIPFIEPGGDFEFQFLTNTQEGVVTCQLGYDDITDVTYSILVTLSPPAGAQPGEYELAFCIVEYDHDEECEYTVWNGYETRQKITERGHRDMCLNAICGGVDILIGEMSPTIVSMFTHEANLPGKALRKMHVVANVFSQAGFTVGQADPYHGREIWLMERAT